MRKNAIFAIGLAALLLTSSATPRAGATTLTRLTLTQLARAADAVVRARCVSTESRWDGGAIWTFTEFDVLERLKGSPPERVIVRLPGGRVGHIVASVEAAPQFQPGEEGFLFLEKTRAGDYSVSDWAGGTFRVRRAELGTAAAVTQESSTFPVFDPTTRRFRTEGVRNLPEAQFRERLAAALAEAASGAAR